MRAWLWTLIGYLCLLVAIPAQAGFVTRSGSSLQLEGQPVRFIGFNYRGLCHYGYKDYLPQSIPSFRYTQLSFADSCNARVVRAFVPWRGITPEQTGDRLEEILNLAAQFNVFIIATLIDFYGVTGLCPMGDETQYYWNNNYYILTPQFFVSGFRTNYLPQAAYLADRFKDRRELLAWELGNEISCYSNPTAFVDFCLETATAIKAADPNHLISTGLLNTCHTNLNSTERQRLYGNANIDLISGHYYDGTNACDDSPYITQFNKPMFIGEAGMSSGDRPTRTSNDIQKWVNRGVCGYIQWGVVGGATYDIGDGDGMYGVDMVGHLADFDAYKQVFRNWGVVFGSWPQATPTPSRTPMPSWTPTAPPSPTATETSTMTATPPDIPTQTTPTPTLTPTCARHSADYEAPYGKIGLSELLRVIQFFALGSYQCATGTEDGYAPGATNRSCQPHASDFAPQNWQISLSELLRLIQLYNYSGYTCDPAHVEDGYRPL